MDYWKQSKESLYVAAHRGWRAKYPENTMPAFRAALELGVDQIETDVRITKDGELVLIHDSTLKRVSGDPREVRACTFEELRRIDVGSHLDPKFSDARIPRLRELFELVKDHPTITLDIELKEYPSREPGWEAVSHEVCDRTLAMVDEYCFSDRVVINTFSEQLIDYIVEKYGGKYRLHVYFPRFNMADHGTDPYANAYCACVFGPSKVASGELTMKEILDFSRETGIEIWAGTYAKDEAGVDFALAMGSTLITADNPDEVLAILRQRGLHN